MISQVKKFLSKLPWENILFGLFCIGLVAGGGLLINHIEQNRIEREKIEKIQDQKTQKRINACNNSCIPYQYTFINYRCHCRIDGETWQRSEI